jgi:hypothetical protein
VSKIVESLRSSVLIDIHESSTKIRRNLDMPLPEGNSENRSVYLKGFHKSDTKLDVLLGMKISKLCTFGYRRYMKI